MRYDYDCQGCGHAEERSIPVEERDLQFCMECLNPLVRVFTPAQIMVPERFGMNMRSFMPTYDELAAIDKRNDDYLNQKKAPAKPSFEDFVEKECVKQRVDPKQLNEYTLDQMGKPS